MTAIGFNVHSPDTVYSGKPATPVPMLHSSNAFKSKTSSSLADSVRYALEHPVTKKSHVDYMCRSHSTMAFRTGVIDGKQKHYHRCPITGTWFLNEPHRRLNFCDSKSPLTMKLTRAKVDNPVSVPESVWPAPCHSGVWVDKIPDKPTSMVIDSHETNGILTHAIERANSTPILMVPRRR
eukprot:TRINITY_DN392_c0_g1_i1.p1 TRINITY_DN392_c0_g1~~TRINITY_DN392_c0_g1_i1.p1  ORF type:complete len:180 (-),score=22.64 TRINITY_DN392_c0_g1_i1:106-645(-)